jgi:hypothetical protein
VALANHRKAIRAELARYGKRFRRLQLDAIAEILTDLGISLDACPPIVVLLTLLGLSQVMALEGSLGMTSGHDETVAFVRGLLEDLERPAEPGAPDG